MNTNEKKKSGGCLSVIFTIVLIAIIIGMIGNKMEKENNASSETQPQYEESYTADAYHENYDYYQPEVNQPVYEQNESYENQTAPDPQEQAKPSHKSALTDDRIIADIYECNSELGKAGLKIKSFEITNRDSGDNMETLWITYIAEDNDCVYYGEILFVYSYDENFWRLDVVEHGSNYYEAKYACDENIPLSYVGDVYARANAEITLMERNRKDVNEEVFDIFATWRENEVVMNTDDHFVTCVFDLYDGWRVADATQSRYYESWDVCGRYTLNNDKLSAVVDLTNFEIDVQKNIYTATFTYSFTSHVSNDDIYGGPTMQKGVTYSSKGPITVKCDRGYENEYVSLNVDNLVDMYICGRPINWDPIGSGYGVWVKVRSNYAQTYGEYWLYK